MGIIMSDTIIITVCLEETPVLNAFMDGRVRDFFTYMKTRFILQILYKNASLYLQYLRIIDKKSDIVEKELYKSPTKPGAHRDPGAAEEPCVLYYLPSFQ